MKEQLIKDFYGRILGKIETNVITGNRTVKDFYGRILGYYDSRLDITTDFYHRIIGHGDMCSSLIYQNSTKKK